MAGNGDLEGQTRLHAPTREEGALPRGSLLLNGTYRIEARLGAGGMGEVYRAVNTITGSATAIKIIRDDLAADEFIIQLFSREAAALRTVRDGAVVGYEGAFRDEQGRVFLAMEFVDGPSLAERMRERPLAEEEVLRLKSRLTRGLAAAHAVGVFHRDLSPDNVLLPGGRLDDAVIIDFGIAKHEGGTGPTLFGDERQGFTGKFAYASPEQAGVVQGAVDGRSDIYSLGLVLAAAARGEPLPMGTDPMTAYSARTRVPDLSSLTPRLQEELRPMLASDPADRPQAMTDLVSAPATPAAKRPVAPEGGRRGRHLLIGGGLAGLAVVVGAGAYLLMQPLPPPPIPAAGPPSQPMVEQETVPPTPQDRERETAAMIESLKPPPISRPQPAATGDGEADGAQTQADAVPPVVAAMPANTASAEQPLLEPDSTPAEPAVDAATVAATEPATPAAADLALATPEATPAATPPPEPGPDPEALRGQVRAALGSFPCSRLDFEMASDGEVRVAGTVASDAQIAAVTRALHDIDGIDRVAPALAVVPAMHCLAATEIEGLVGHGAPPPGIRLNRPDGRYLAGRDVFIAYATAPASSAAYLYVDYFHENGDVYHLLPEPNLRDNHAAAGQTIQVGHERAERSPTTTVWEPGAPFGEGEIVVIASETPIYDGLRSIGEDAQAYLDLLAQAIPKAAAQGRVGMTSVPIMTRSAE